MGPSVRSDDLQAVTLPPKLAAVRVHTTRRGNVAWMVLGCVGGSLQNLSSSFATAAPSLRYHEGYRNITGTLDDLRAAAHVLGVTIEPVGGAL